MSNRKNSENSNDFSLMSLSNCNRDLVTLWRKKKWRESSVMMYEVVGFVFVVLSSNFFGIFFFQQTYRNISDRHPEIFLAGTKCCPNTRRAGVFHWHSATSNCSRQVSCLELFSPNTQNACVFVRIWVYLTIYAFLRPDGDVQLLVLSREESNELFHNYPEQVNS